VSTPVFHGRRAQRLARLLDQADGRPRRPDTTGLDGRLAGYVQLRDRLRGAAGLLPEPCPEFRTNLRDLLLATAQRDGVGRGTGCPATRSTP
jgi:hypothetical protein